MTANGSYAAMAGYYDDIMLLGGPGGGPYYDYEAIAAGLAAAGPAAILELGFGTGLVLEHLMLKGRAGYDRVAGIDLTPEMLPRAAARLQPWPDISLRIQDVTGLDLPGEKFDLIWSFGGPWYCVPGRGAHTLISHIRPRAGNARGLAAVAAHLAPGGRLLLGVQPPHRPYTTTLATGATYLQQLRWLPGGFQKRYLLTSPDDSRPLVDQVTNYRTYRPGAALALLAQAGLRPVPAAARRHGPMFREFTLR